MTTRLTKRQFLGATIAAAATAPMALRASVPDFLTIGGGPSGGVFNIVSTGLANLLRGVYPDTIIDVQPGGSGPNILRVSAGKADLGITSASNAFDAYHGRDPATPEAPVQNLRGLMTIMQSAVQIWVDGNSDIRSLQDLRGKRISAGQPGQTSWLAFEKLLAAADMSMEDIEADGGRIAKLSWSESHNALRNGELDAVMWLSLWPHPTVRQNETVRPMRALSIDPAVLDRFLENSGGFERVTLPEGLFEGQDSPAETVGTNTILFTSEKMSDEAAKEIVKTVWENLEEFKKTHALLGNISAETVGKGMVIPLHDGAKAYFDEQGIAYGEPQLKTAG
ncbi:TAXI family TRAP transporter solute-binding subunit [Sulfitobacter aestuarii]|uniref:TAXI family TRAP transporter solute-binding subunit n=1 Tax=Sulfitobacter aestuarii TaxID=2161676 RepID=A0ABW5U6A6_9RHOB